MKLAQRIAIGYYKTKIKGTALLSMQKAAEQTYRLFCTPYSGKPKRAVPPNFNHAEALSVQLDGLTVRGWRWKAKEANARKVLVAHGFDSCSYKFDKHIQRFHQQGFEVLAFDAPAHGISDGKIVNALIYKNAMLLIEEKYGPLYAIMGHSFGGLAASLAAEQIGTLKKLVVIAPATETISAVNSFFKAVPLGNAIRAEVEKYIVNIAQKPLSFFSVTRAVQNLPNTNILWLHDKEDAICSFADVQPAIDLHLPNLQFHITKGLGHNKIYRDEKVSKAIADFLVG